MNTKKIEKETKVIIIVILTIGIILLATGVVFSFLGYRVLPNNKALIGVSFMPLGVALIYYLKLTKIRKSPEKMRSIIISENDERIAALKNDADAKTLKIIKGLLFMSYMGYTLMVPEDIFEAVGWWILLGLFFTTFMLQGILTAKAMRKEKSTEEDK